MKKKQTAKVLLLVAVSGLSLVGAELWVRWMGSEDADGNFSVFRRTVRPYRLPIQSVRTKVAEYVSSSSSFVVYDPDLGWVPRGGGRSRDGLYCYDQEGIRSQCVGATFEPKLIAGGAVIELFGDSFTHGDDVEFEATWGAHLEAYLRQGGVTVQTLNFGVGGYGIDQAYLRWRRTRRESPPRIVILGFQATDVKRNINLLRPLNNPGTSLPFSKPRFVLDDDLRLVNVPALPPTEVADVLEQLGSWELRQYEGLLESSDYEAQSWERSRLISFGTGILAELLGLEAESESGWYELDGKAAILTLKIIERFAGEVAEEGATFMIVHLPKWAHLEALLEGRELPYRALLEELDRRHGVVDPASRLVQAARDESLGSLFVGHYSESANRIVAETIGEAVLRMLSAETGSVAGAQ